MRTTVTLDYDVELLIRERMAKSNKRFKEVINESVRIALAGSEATHPFKVESFDLGFRSGFDPASMHDVDAELEAEEFLRKTRKLELERSRHIAEP